MSRIWRVVSTVVLALIVLGALAAAIGWFTGGSPERMVTLIFGSREGLRQTVDSMMNQTYALLEQALAILRGLFAQVQAALPV